MNVATALRSSSARYLVVSLLLASMMGFAPVYGKENWTDWKVSRQDYVEFCNGNSIEINLADGSLRGSLGTCAPDLGKPSKMVEAQASGKDLADLRTAIHAASIAGYVSPTCAGVAGPPVLSGPVSLEITRPNSQITTVTRSPCPTAEGRKVFQSFERAVAPLHRYGFRRWN